VWIVQLTLLMIAPVLMLTADLPINYGIVLYPGFQALDAFGPLDVLNLLSLSHPLQLSVIASNLEPVSTQVLDREQNVADSRFSQSIVPTHTFDAPPAQLDVLLVPGGFGTTPPTHTDDAVAYIKKVYPSLKYIFTVCDGSTLVARAGILDGRRATTNKKAWAQGTSLGPNVNWVPQARWVVDGNIWTTSGVAAGMDGIFSFVGKVYGEETARSIANVIEYEPHTDPSWDPFSKVWNVPKTE
jgi:transcriptional regulator GlxA family with amidase domain